MAIGEEEEAGNQDETVEEVKEKVKELEEWEVLEISLLLVELENMKTFQALDFQVDKILKAKLEWLTQ